MKIRTSLFASATALASFVASAPALAFTPVTVPIPQQIISAVIGNGVQQSKPIVSVPSSAMPLVGVGALSGGPNHYGTLLSVSLLNTARLVGIDGPGGKASPLSISLANPKLAPVLSPVK
jgi:hypothetical protein